MSAQGQNSAPSGAQYDPDTYLTWNAQRTLATLVLTEPASVSSNPIELAHQLANSVKSIMPCTSSGPGNFECAGDLRTLMSSLSGPGGLHGIISQEVPSEYWDPNTEIRTGEEAISATLRMCYNTHETECAHILYVTPVRSIAIPIPDQSVVESIATASGNGGKSSAREGFLCGKLSALLSALPDEVQTYIAVQAGMTAEP